MAISTASLNCSSLARHRWHSRSGPTHHSKCTVRLHTARCNADARSTGAAQTVIERRAADVLVLGSGPVAYSAAYSLAKSGQKVILLEDYGLHQQPRPRPTLQPLVLMHTSYQAAHLASEAAAYWRGLEMLSGSTMLRSCPTLAFGAGSSSSAAAEKLERVRQACQEAGVPLSLLVASEVSGKFSSMTLPNGYTTLMQEQGGGLLLPVEAESALVTLCKQAGVALRDTLVLRAWKDAGGHFVAQASSRVTPDLLSVFEAERLLLAPGHWAPSCWSLFHLSSQLSTLQLANTRVAAASDLIKAPIWHHVGQDCLASSATTTGSATDSSAAGASSAGGGAIAGAGAFKPTSEPAGLPSCLGMPLLNDGGKATLLQASWYGKQLEGPGSYLAQPDSAQLAAAQQVHAAAVKHVRGLDAWEGSGSRCQLVHGTRDGLPIVDFHPGFEAGRVVVATTASSTDPSVGLGSSGYQLAPIAAKVAADLLRCGSSPDVDLATLGLAREAVQGSSSLAGAAVDTWGALAQLQQGPQDLMSEEERQDLEADARADQRERSMTGKQFFSLQE